jgi:hypothetical protein
MTHGISFNGVPLLSVFGMLRTVRNRVNRRDGPSHHTIRLPSFSDAKYTSLSLQKGIPIAVIPGLSMVQARHVPYRSENLFGSLKRVVSSLFVDFTYIILTSNCVGEEGLVFGERQRLMVLISEEHCNEDTRYGAPSRYPKPSWKAPYCAMCPVFAPGKLHRPDRLGMKPCLRVIQRTFKCHAIN